MTRWPYLCLAAGALTGAALTAANGPTRAFQGEVPLTVDGRQVGWCHLTAGHPVDLLDCDVTAGPTEPVPYGGQP